MPRRPPSTTLESSKTLQHVQHGMICYWCRYACASVHRVAFADFFRMESLSALRCLSRKSVTCLMFACFMFFACAFYSFATDSYNSIAPYSDAGSQEWKSDSETKPPALVVFDSHRENEAGAYAPDSMLKNEANARTSPPLSHGPGTQAKLVPVPKHFLLSETPIPLRSPDRSKSNTSGHIPQKRSEHAKTRYIHLVNTSSTTAPTSTSVAAAYNNTDTCHLTMKDPKLILLWTPFFDYWNYLPESRFRQCSRCRNCKVTTDRSRLLESDAVIFHARDMSVTDMPAVRLPHQRWVFYCLESPPYSDFPGLEYTANMFNWTMTYRSDSDIAAPYGTVSKVRPPRRLDMQYLEWSWSNKTKSVAWMTSHCPTHGARDSYVQELKKYIDVDIYGSCGTSVCPPGETERCHLEFAQKYKFFLAFENTICKDYVTEKFYRTLQYDIIPVVFGGADYSKFAPPGSFIEALSFKSPKHLAFFLAGVGKNFKLYSSFFQWRKSYSIDLSNNKECRLCSMLHSKDLKPSAYRNLRDWWVYGSYCKVWKPKR